MKTLYLIPGTGADHRFFSRLQLDVKTQVIEWSEWGNAQTIREYAEVLSLQIDKDESFGILGVSFGGMLAVEMSKFLNPEKLILVSSAKSYKELPSIVRLSRRVGVHYLISPRLIKIIPFAGKIFGVSKKDKRFFDKMIDETPAGHLKKTIRSVLYWKNTVIPSKIIHIHGSQDKVIPIKNIQNPAVIKGGGHFMVYNMANEVSQIINKSL